MARIEEEEKMPRITMRLQGGDTSPDAEKGFWGQLTGQRTQKGKNGKTRFDKLTQAMQEGYTGGTGLTFQRQLQLDNKTLRELWSKETNSGPTHGNS